MRRGGGDGVVSTAGFLIDKVGCALLKGIV